MHLWGCHMPLRNNSQTWISIKPGFWDIMAMEANFLTVKYLTGLWQSLAVPTYTVDVVTAGLCHNPVKYFMLLRGCLCARTHVGMLGARSD